MTKPTPAESQAIDALLPLWRNEFMRPSIYYGRAFLQELDNHGGTFWCIGTHGPLINHTVIEERDTILVRLSAPGYLDCTEWEACESWQECIDTLRSWTEELQSLD